MQKISTFISLLFLVFNSFSNAQIGKLDDSFSADGKVTVGVSNTLDIAHSVAVQKDGKIVVAGTYMGSSDRNAIVVRFHPDGTLDNTFNTDGIATHDFGLQEYLYSIAIQDDGKIVAAGISATSDKSDFLIVRYTKSGQLDTAFNSNGRVITDLNGWDIANKVMIQKDGKIIIAGGSGPAGSFDFAAVRYNSNGTLDNSFNFDGIFTHHFGKHDNAESAVLQDDGKIILAGYTNWLSDNDFALLRLKPNGTLDSTFGDKGINISTIGKGARASSCALQPDGKLIIAGYTTDIDKYSFAVIRYDTNGNEDKTFDQDAKKIISVTTGSNKANSVICQPDGQIVIVGDVFFGTDLDFGILRLNADGTIDNDFGSGGFTRTSFVNSNDFAINISIQPDGNLVVCGKIDNGLDVDMAVVRYLSGLNLGILEFQKEGKLALVYPNPVNPNTVVKYSLRSQESISIDLFDPTGKLVKSIIKEENKQKGDHQEKLCLEESMTPGLYLLQISNGFYSYQVKIIK
jgi:uncharacterized delta-60 repeat protein